MTISTTKTFHITMSDIEAGEIVEDIAALREVCTNAGLDNVPEKIRQFEELICEYLNS